MACDAFSRCYQYLCAFEPKFVALWQSLSAPTWLESGRDMASTRLVNGISLVHNHGRIFIPAECISHLWIPTWAEHFSLQQIANYRVELYFCGLHISCCHRDMPVRQHFAVISAKQLRIDKDPVWQSVLGVTAHLSGFHSSIALSHSFHFLCG